MQRVTFDRLDQALRECDGLLGKKSVSEKRACLSALLFLKYCDDAYLHKQQEILREELERTGDEDRARTEADDPGSYGDVIVVPDRARWADLAEADGTAGRLNAAMQEIETANDDLRGISQSIRFKPADNAALDRMMALLDPLPLHDGATEHRGVVGEAYEAMLLRFAEGTGTKAGDHYTPRSVVRLMIRLIGPRPGDTVYDPCVGSGGTLIHARAHVADHHPGRQEHLAVYGQEIASEQLASARINLLLHGVRDFDVQQGDTLATPRHTTGTGLRTFKKIISNPEFSGKGVPKDDDLYGRFVAGESGNKPDLLFVKHMLASLAPGGTAVTVMPHGVLFRGRKEQTIRARLLEEDRIEAVIGLAPSIFFGSGIPVCLLVLRNGGTPEHRGRVLFVNADREYTPGRVRNQLGEEHAEKIVSVCGTWRELPGFSRVVTVADLLADEANLNIRRWVDNTPPPEPDDVSAHLYGGVPLAEIAAAQEELGPFGIRLLDHFVPCDERYLAFPPTGPGAELDRIERTAEKSLAEVRASAGRWWDRHVDVLAGLEGRTRPSEVREKLIASFTDEFGADRVLDEFAWTGVIADWWASHLHTVNAWSEHGPLEPVRNWHAAIEAAEAENRRDAYAHPLAVRLLPDFLPDLALLDAERSRLNAEVKEAEEAGEPATALKKQRTAARKAVQEHEATFRPGLAGRVSGLDGPQARDLVADILHEDLAAWLDRRLATARDHAVSRYRTLIDKYERSLEQLEAERSHAAERLARCLADLAYPRREVSEIS
ncbi:HsdM family class I SAM-dependent methyltransferase [Actinomadura flavalba]|uniref:class I SAM-dependent DNA methyltransferase n=1 Tax=Actinomadura flavalba TaxID=1120938 RepID=UPI000362E1A8|nr:class I SAM-dependent DNA methyltransferase [Actinomadura flavalba]